VEVLLLAAVGVFVVATWATIYPDGGAFQWGGRFLAPAVVPLAAVAAGGLRSVARRPGMPAALVALAIVSSVSGVAVIGSSRDFTAAVYDRIEAERSPVNVTTAELLPRMMFREQMDWLRPTPEDLNGMLDRMRAAGVEQVTVVAPTDVAARIDGWPTVEDRGEVSSVGLRILVLRQ
jgi:hypothetical protein